MTVQTYIEVISPAFRLVEIVKDGKSLTESNPNFIHYQLSHRFADIANREVKSVTAKRADTVLVLSV